MHGNITEWCEDVFDEGFYSTPDASDADPLSTTGSNRRVARGGFWNLHEEDCRSSERLHYITTLSFSFMGFRAAYWPLP